MCKNSDLKSSCAARLSLQLNEQWVVQPSLVSSWWCIFTSLPVGEWLVGHFCYYFLPPLCLLLLWKCTSCVRSLSWIKRCVWMTVRWTISLLRFRASLQHEGFSTQPQTKQNKPIKRGRTRRASKLAVECGLKWAVGVRDVRLFSSVCRRDKTGGGFVLNQASLSCSVMGTLPKKVSCDLGARLLKLLTR